MSRPIELTDETYKALTTAAAESGQSPDGWIASRLPPRRVKKKLLKKGETIYDRLKDSIGKFSSKSKGRDSHAIEKISVERTAEKHLVRQSPKSKKKLKLKPGESLYDALAPYIGKYGSKGTGRWSEDCGKKFAEGLEEKRRTGTL